MNLNDTHLEGRVLTIACLPHKTESKTLNDYLQLDLQEAVTEAEDADLTLLSYFQDMDTIEDHYDD